MQERSIAWGIDPISLKGVEQSLRHHEISSLAGIGLDESQVGEYIGRGVMSRVFAYGDRFVVKFPTRASKLYPVDREAGYEAVQRVAFGSNLGIADTEFYYQKGKLVAQKQVRMTKGAVSTDRKGAKDIFEILAVFNKRLQSETGASLDLIRFCTRLPKMSKNGVFVLDNFMRDESGWINLVDFDLLAPDLLLDTRNLYQVAVGFAISSLIQVQSALIEREFGVSLN